MILFLCLQLYFQLVIFSPELRTLLSGVSEFIFDSFINAKNVQSAFAKNLFFLHEYIYFHTKNITTNYLLHLFDCTYNMDNKIFELLTRQYLQYLQYTKYTKLAIHALLYNTVLKETT